MRGPPSIESEGHPFDCFSSSRSRKFLHQTLRLRSTPTRPIHISGSINIFDSDYAVFRHGQYVCHLFLHRGDRPDDYPLPGRCGVVDRRYRDLCDE